MQKVNFDYEISIIDDASTDRTQEILRSFETKQRNKFRLLLREKNLGGSKNFVEMVKACRGDYIALLDGDDYWTSPDKLQKQVDFLEMHPECAICFHRFTWLDYDRGRESDMVPSGQKAVYYLEDLLEFSFPFLTSFLMFRRNSVDEFPAWFHDSGFGDWALGILAARNVALKRRVIFEQEGRYPAFSAGTARDLFEVLKSLNNAGAYTLSNILKIIKRDTFSQYRRPIAHFTT